MENLVKIIKESLKNDWDAVCAVCGLEGTGKSTLSIQLSRRLDEKFTLERNVIFQPTVENVTKTIYDLPRFSPVDVDEAMRTMYKRSSMTSDSRIQAIIFSICRKQNKPVFLNIPNFFDLDPYYRNHRVRVWLFVPKRGVCIVMMKDNSPFVKDPWHKDENQKIIDRFTRKDKSSVGLLITAMRNTKNYIYEFKFDDLDPKTKSLYRYYSNKLDPMDLLKEDKWKIRFIKLLKYVLKADDLKEIRQYKIAKGTGLSEGSISELFNYDLKKPSYSVLSSDN